MKDCAVVHVKMHVYGGMCVLYVHVLGTYTYMRDSTINSSDGSTSKYCKILHICVSARLLRFDHDEAE